MDFNARRSYLNTNEVPQCILLHEINRRILLHDGFIGRRPMKFLDVSYYTMDSLVVGNI